LNWLSLDKRKPSMSIIGSHSSRSLFENPASNTAARVSLPLTMSNISRTNGLSPGYPPHPFWPVLAGPVCERAGYKTQSSFPSTAFLELFSATRRRPKNFKKRADEGFLGPIAGPASNQLWSAGGGDIRSPYSPRKRFLIEIA
jgi:hypothetical protein